MWHRRPSCRAALFGPGLLLLLPHSFSYPELLDGEGGPGCAVPAAAHSNNRVPSPPSAELKAVDFGNNSMGKEGAAALADLLRGSQTITDVNINMNDVGNDGAFQVRSADLFAGCRRCALHWLPLVVVLLPAAQQLLGACLRQATLLADPGHLLPSLDRLRPPSPAPRPSSCWMWAATTSARTAPRPWHVSWLVWAGREAVGWRALQKYWGWGSSGVAA